MDDIFYSTDNTAGFAGIDALQKASGKTQAAVTKFLNKQPTYRKFKVPRKTFKRARIEVASAGMHYQADLFDLQKFGRYNKGYKWIVLVVDAFTRFVKCQPTKNKTGPEVARALDVIFTQLENEGRKATNSYLATNLGNEFFNKHAEIIYKKHKVSHFPLRAPIKAGMAEITGRYIVTRLYKIMEHFNTKRWFDQLQSAVDAKNKRKNKKTAGLSPDEISFVNQHEVSKILYPEQKPVAFTLNIGDLVQVVKHRLPFAKSYQGYYTDKLYRITKRHNTTIPRYSIADEEDGEPIIGTWYAEELYRI